MRELHHDDHRREDEQKPYADDHNEKKELAHLALTLEQVLRFTFHLLLAKGLVSESEPTPMPIRQSLTGRRVAIAYLGGKPLPTVLASI